MFSELGTNAAGQEETYARHVDSMFRNFGTDKKPDYRLSGEFIPNLFLNLSSGEIKSNKLSEPFQLFKIEDGKAGKIINEKENYNISIQNNPNSYNNVYPGMVCMPNPTSITTKKGVELVKCSWYSDGANSTVIYQASDSYMNWKGSAHFDLDNLKNWLVILCADGRILNEYSYRREYLNENNYTTLLYAPQGYAGVGDDYEGYFVVNGCYSKFLILAPGDIVKLKQCITSKGGIQKIYWYVENQTDFNKIPLKIEVQPSYYCDESTNKLVEETEEDHVIFDHTSGSGYYYGKSSAWTTSYVKDRFANEILQYEVYISNKDDVIQLK
jgi:hypothetical protein